jgi:hypothetical protein
LQTVIRILLASAAKAQSPVARLSSRRREDKSATSTTDPSARRTGELTLRNIGEGGRKKYPGRQRRIRSSSAAMPARTPSSRVLRKTKLEQLSAKMQRSRSACGAKRWYAKIRPTTINFISGRRQSKAFADRAASHRYQSSPRFPEPLCCDFERRRTPIRRRCLTLSMPRVLKPLLRRYHRGSPADQNQLPYIA